MPGSNKPLGPPLNTHAKNIPVGVHLSDIPIYWGDNQILDESLNYSEPSLPGQSPLHIPRVVRFLYAYSSSDTPFEIDATMCGCTGVKNCSDIDCTWTMNWSKRMEIGYVVSQTYIDNGWWSQIPDGGTTQLSTMSFLSVRPKAHGLSTILKVFSDIDHLNNNDPDIYEGPIYNAPSSVMTRVSVFSTYWTKNCVQKVGGAPASVGGCNTVHHAFYGLIDNENTSLQCSLSALPASFATGLTFGSDQFGIGNSWNVFNVSTLLAPGYSDYPSAEDYDGGCIDEEYPC